MQAFFIFYRRLNKRISFEEKKKLQTYIFFSLDQYSRPYKEFKCGHAHEIQANDKWFTVKTWTNVEKVCKHII